jgi:formylglycine-generating enzyme required for sulfatase activity
MEYLRALSPAERDERRPRSGGGYGPYAVRLEGDGPFELVIERDGKVTRTGQEGHLQYPDRATRREVRWVRTPVSGVTVTDARAYAAWMSTSGRLPGARLCTQLEWERAARGADGRLYPPGDMIEPDDANIDVTYGRLAQSFGADEVGAHPRSDSPFGVADLFGNVWELVETGIPSVVKMRGGTYYHGAASGQSANREFAEAALRSPWTGLRLCADPPDVP